MKLLISTSARKAAVAKTVDPLPALIAEQKRLRAALDKAEAAVTKEQDKQLKAKLPKRGMIGVLNRKMLKCDGPNTRYKEYITVNKVTATEVSYTLAGGFNKGNLRSNLFAEYFKPVDKAVFDAQVKKAQVAHAKMLESMKKRKANSRGGIRFQR